MKINLAEISQDAANEVEQMVGMAKDIALFDDGPAPAVFARALELKAMCDDRCVPMDSLLRTVVVSHREYLDCLLENIEGSCFSNSFL